MNNIKYIPAIDRLTVPEGAPAAVGVRGVLAAAYPGGNRSNPATMLTHGVALFLDGDEAWVLCSRVRLESLCDLAESGPPTCPTCARRAAK